MNICVGIVGLSHLGLITGLGIASKGASLVGYDPDKNLIAKLRSGELPVFEPGLEELLSESKSRVTFTSDAEELSHCEIVYIARDVPTSHQNISEVAPVLELFKQILPSLKRDSTIVIHSQVSPGFTRALAPLISKENRGIHLYYQVETLVFGIAVSRMLNPERYIVGCGDPTAEFPAPYKALLLTFGCPILPMRYESAELAKISINMFLVSSVITASTLAELCEEIGADWGEIIPALKLDKRIGPHAYLSAGLGLSGGNLERDLVSVQSLARTHGTDSSVVEAWFTHAQYRRDWVVRTLSEVVFAQNQNPTIAVWGIAYKQDTHSIKNSPSIALLDVLKTERVRAYDPKVSLGERARGGVIQAENELNACAGADVLVVMTPWKQFREVLPEDVAQTMKGRIILDPFGALDEMRYQKAGFTVYRLGKSF